ncbi:HK97 gp10 family phage protein [Rhizobium sp. YJ-22]|uniref:HK97-gp10 family putative phage morphogenesis protein n=1 Tax=Rhizobium sp. YJ-22 TaxID=3037556 RepID=UPI002412A5D0|nr:HK97-gp10 family putative phage morphogenesis protein [Rhizobium sp. YJ-22]MDG3575726.1 HK97 gp10 family phage protein [Rhizobium sp. YJ-22]
MANDGGLSRIQKRLNAIPRKVREAATQAAAKVADDIADDMRHFALSSKDTGALIESITVTGPEKNTPPFSQPGGAAVVPEGTYRITAGDEEVRYAHLVEYGHNAPGGEAQPFFWPAVRANKKRATSTMTRAIRKAIKDDWGKK